MQTLNPADFLDTQASPKQREAAGRATVAEAEAGVAPEAARTDVRQKAGSAASSEASAARTEALTPEELRKIQLENAATEAAAAAAKRAAGTKAASDTEAVNNILERIAEARRLVSGWSTGFGSYLGDIPTTQARSLKGLLGPEGTISANILLRTMEQMRAGSAAGATGLGAMDRNENRTLKNSIDNLDLGRNPEEVLETLNNIERKFRRYSAITSGYNPDDREVALQFGLIPPEDKEGSKGIPQGTIGGVTSEENVERPPERRGLNVTVSKMLREGRSAADIKAYLDKVEPGLGAKTTNLEWWETELKKPKDKQGPGPEDYIDVETLRTEASAPEKAIGDFAQSGLGTTLLGATDFATMGAIPSLTGDAQAARAAIKGAELERPGAFTIGQAIGGITGLTGAEQLAARYGLNLSPAMMAAVQSGLYGYGASDKEGLAAVPDAVTSAITGGIGGKIGDVGGQTLGRVVSGIRDKTGQALGNTTQAIRDKALAELSKRNIPLTLGEIVGPRAQKFESRLSQLPIVGPAISARLGEGTEAFNRAALTESLEGLGEKYADFGADVGARGVRNARKNVSQAFTDALSGVTLVQDDVFQRNLSNAWTELGELPDVGPKMLKALNDQLGDLLKPGRNLTGEEVQAALGKVNRIGRSFKNNELFESSIAPRLNAVEGEIRGVVERQAPDILPQFDAARGAWRKVSVLGDAVKRATPKEGFDTRGVFTPEQLQAAAMANAEKFTGKGSSVTRDYPFQELAETGLDVLTPRGRTGSPLGLPVATAGLIGAGGYFAQPGEETDPRTGAVSGEPRDLVVPSILAGAAATLAGVPYSRVGQNFLNRAMFDPRGPNAEVLGNLLERYAPRTLAGAYSGVLGGKPTSGTPDITGEEEVSFQPVTITPQVAVVEEATKGAAPVAEESPVLVDGRPTEIRGDGRRYFIGTDEPAEADPLAYRSDPALGMYRGGTVRAFKNGGDKGEKKQTSFFDDAIMAVSRRSNDLVAAAADLADKYGITPANATAWIAQNVAGYSPQQAAQIRRNLSGVSNRAIVNAGAASNETRFRNAGGVGARKPDEVTPPARLSDIGYRPADVPRAAISETPKALRAAGNYLTSTSPQTMLSDAQRAGSVAIQEVMKDPYGMAVDSALYGAGRFVALPAAAFDLAAMRGGSRELAQYAQDNPEAAQAKAIFDALAVLPVAGAGGVVGRRLTKKR